MHNLQLVSKIFKKYAFIFSKIIVLFYSDYTRGESTPFPTTILSPRVCPF